MIDLDILVVLDRSGSMQDMKADHEGGLRAFVDDQKTMPGDVRLTFVQFDTEDPCEIVYDRVPIADVGPITLIPRGGTPLLDAVGKAIAHLRTAQRQAPATQTVIMIVTDGEENSSREWTKAKVTALTTEMEKAGATVLYLGANVDAFTEAGSIGVAHVHALNYAAVPQSVAAAYAMNSSKTLRSRQAVASGMSMTSANAIFDYTDEERVAVSGPAPVTTTTTISKDGE